MRTLRATLAAITVGAVALVGCSSSGSSARNHPKSGRATTTSTSRSTVSHSSGTAATPGVTSSLAPGVAGSVPAGTPGDATATNGAFCRQVTAVQRRLADLDPTKTSAADRLAASQQAFAEVTADAPASIKPDLVIVNDFVAHATSLDALAGTPPADLGPAMQRVVAWFSANCGVALQIG
ncbi:MAG: hypothetical protein JST73_10100 [Actinobacteria bacterium]|nr:hypothetical protein [Actinomycetota bacterium]